MFNSVDCLLRKSLKYCLDSSARCTLGGGGGLRTGSPRAKARDDDEELIPGGGGVGYAVDGELCWRRD